MAEHLALEELGRDRAHVDRDERRLGARAEPVGRPGEQLLASARLAGQEDRQRGARGLLEVVEEREHRGIARDDAKSFGLALQALELRVAEPRVADLGGARRPHALLQLFEPGAGALFLSARVGELRPQRHLTTARSSHRGARRFQVFFERLHRRLLTHEALADRRDFAFEVAHPVSRAELSPDEGARRGNRRREQRDRYREEKADH